MSGSWRAASLGDREDLRDAVHVRGEQLGEVDRDELPARVEHEPRLAQAPREDVRHLVLGDDPDLDAPRAEELPEVTRALRLTSGRRLHPEREVQALEDARFAHPASADGRIETVDELDAKIAVERGAREREVRESGGARP
jgi:hypothetical protein